MTPTLRRLLAFALVVGVMAAVPRASFAQAEITGVVGGLLGGDLNNLISGTSSIESAFDNGPLYGVRVGWVGGFIGAEGSYVYSPSGLAISAPNRDIGLDGRVHYLEGNFLVVPIPGPVSPFFTVGAGWHAYTLELEAGARTSDEIEIKKMGWNFGGGLKINIGALTLRGEVRDHITTIGPDDFAASDIASDLGFTEEEHLHNVEVSGGIGIRF